MLEAGSVSVIGGAAHNFGVAPMLWRGIGIGPIADAIALVFPEHGRDTADSDRSAGRVSERTALAENG